MTGYYVEDLDSLPIELVVSAMGSEVPRPFAVAYAWWHRFRAQIGWRSKPLGATKWDPNVNWRRDKAPSMALTQWGPWLEQFDDLGFEQIGWIESPTIGDKREANLWLRSSDGRTFGQLNWTLIGSIEDGNTSLTSFLNDDCEQQTISIRNRWQNTLLEHIAPDYVDLVPVKTHSLQRLLQAHEDRFQANQPKSLAETEFKSQLLVQLERFFQHSIEHGVLRELSEDEVRHLVKDSN